MLEFFSEGADDPSALARLAHDSATIRLRSEVQPTAAAVATPASTSTRPISEPPKHKAVMKSSPLTKHMSTPQPPPPPVSLYEDEPFPKKQRNIAPLPSTPSPYSTKHNPFFNNQLQQQPVSQPAQGLIQPFGHTTMIGGTQATATTGAFYDLTVTHVHPHMQLMSQMTPQQQHQLQQQQQIQRQQQHLQQQQQQQQQPQQQPHLMTPLNVYDDWSSLAGTVVDESVFASAMAMWQQPDLGSGHPGAGG